MEEVRWQIRQRTCFTSSFIDLRGVETRWFRIWSSPFNLELGFFRGAHDGMVREHPWSQEKWLGTTVVSEQQQSKLKIVSVRTVVYFNQWTAYGAPVRSSKYTTKDIPVKFVNCNFLKQLEQKGETIYFFFFTLTLIFSYNFFVSHFWSQHSLNYCVSAKKREK